MGRRAPEPAARWRRLAAEGVDGALGFALVVGAARAFGLSPPWDELPAVGEFDPDMDRIEHRRRMYECWGRSELDPDQREWVGLTTALGLGVQAMVAAARRRTPGKRAFGLKAVGRDGREATRGQIAIRELAKTPTYVLPPAMRGRLVPMRLVLVMALVTADWISLLAGPSGRTLHDRCVGTRVVSEPGAA